MIKRVLNQHYNEVDLGDGHLIIMITSRFYFWYTTTRWIRHRSATWWHYLWHNAPEGPLIHYGALHNCYVARFIFERKKVTLDCCWLWSFLKASQLLYQYLIDKITELTPRADLMFHVRCVLFLKCAHAYTKIDSKFLWLFWSCSI